MEQDYINKLLKTSIVILKYSGKKILTTTTFLITIGIIEMNVNKLNHAISKATGYVTRYLVDKTIPNRFNEIKDIVKNYLENIKQTKNTLYKVSDEAIVYICGILEIRDIYQ